MVIEKIVVNLNHMNKSKYLDWKMKIFEDSTSKDHWTRSDFFRKFIFFHTAKQSDLIYLPFPNFHNLLIMLILLCVCVIDSKIHIQIDHQFWTIGIYVCYIFFLLASQRLYSNNNQWSFLCFGCNIFDAQWPWWWWWPLPFDMCVFE